MFWFDVRRQKREDDDDDDEEEDKQFFFKLYAFILLTSTLVPGINYFVVTTHPLHQLLV